MRFNWFKTAVGCVYQIADRISAPHTLVASDRQHGTHEKEAVIAVPHAGWSSPRLLPSRRPSADGQGSQDNDRLGLDHDRVPAPITTDEAHQNPEELVGRAPLRALARRTRQDRQLLAQQEVLGDQIAVGARERAEQAGEQEQVFERRPS